MPQLLTVGYKMPDVDKWRPQPYYALGHWDGRRRGRPKGIPVFLPDKWGADRLQAPHTQRIGPGQVDVLF